MTEEIEVEYIDNMPNVIIKSDKKISDNAIKRIVNRFSPFAFCRLDSENKKRLFGLLNREHKMSNTLPWDYSWPTIKIED